ncbi:hypothetical protein D3C81_1666970 [compost metagenome]
MQWVRRAGERRTWAYLKPSPSSPRIALAGTRRLSMLTTQWPPGKHESRASMVRSMRMPGLFMSARNMVARPSSSLAMMIARVAPSAPVMNHLRPLIRNSSPTWRAVVCSIDGSEPAPGSGSVMQKHERISPAASGRSQRSFCSSVAIASSMCMLPSSGAAMFSATGPSGE